jgi:hypothetical protein
VEIGVVVGDGRGVAGDQAERGRLGQDVGLELVVPDEEIGVLFGDIIVFCHNFGWFCAFLAVFWGIFATEKPFYRAPGRLSGAPERLRCAAGRLSGAPERFGGAPGWLDRAAERTSGAAGSLSGAVGRLARTGGSSAGAVEGVCHAGEVCDRAPECQVGSEERVSLTPMMARSPPKSGESVDT